jgi:DNA helicase HerA-like ATPase
MSDLVLGWKVDSRGEPEYWLSADPHPGGQKKRDLVVVPADKMATHTVIVAQSGSGKSFFLGRLVEELLLRTSAWCVIFDPNADFRQIHKVKDVWTNARYDRQKGEGFLPNDTREAFERRWSKLEDRIRVFTCPLDEPEKTKLDPPYQSIRVSWPHLDADLLSENLDPLRRSQVYRCHSFVRAIADLVEAKRAIDRLEEKDYELIDVAEKLVQQASAAKERRDDAAEQATSDEVGRIITDEFPFDPLKRDQEEEIARRRGLRSSSDLALEVARKMKDAKSALRALDYVPDEIKDFYFGEAEFYKRLQILAPSPPGETTTKNPLDVIDLPSVEGRRTQALVVNAVMSQIHRQARKAWTAALAQSKDDDRRVPIFIVVDEAHNLAPATPQSTTEEALRDQVRRVAAEGRKYGLFLILVSQRPEKLDPLIVSECENKAVMKVDSKAVVDGIVELFGLEDALASKLEQCVEFRRGRALLIGQWASGSPTPLYVAPRRTVEGGRNLNEDYWTLRPRR